MVLPDPKRSEDDLVLFLDPAHSTAEGPEAEQRACVMALEAVAGERKYDSLLPKQYVPLWKEMGEVRRGRGGGGGSRFSWAPVRLQPWP